MENYPEILQDLADQVAELMVKQGLDPDAAAKIGWETAEFIRRHWGGQKIYLPKGDAYQLSRRDVEIEHKWDGSNSLSLCREYDITHTRLYQIIHAVRRARRGPDPVQPELFKEAVR